MPSQLPLGSFASAAAGQASNRDSRAGSRGDTRGGGEWPRRDNRGPNGTLTLRRSSTTPHGGSISQSSLPDTNPTLPRLDTTGSHVQQSFGPGAENGAGGRYSKDSLLDIYKSQQQFDSSNGDVSSLFVNGWDPASSNGASGRGWGKTGENSRDHGYGPDVCWDQPGHVDLLGLEELSGLEKTIFTGDVNAPVKQTTQNTNKDHNTITTANGRKLSISNTQGGVGSFGLASPTTSRPGARRRETSDSPFGALASPGANARFNRDDSSPFFSRKATEKEHDDRFDDSGAKSNSPFSSLIRSNTGGAGLGNTPSSPWGAGPPSAGMSPMGAFGNFAIGGGSAAPPTPSEKRPGFGSIRGESRLAQLMPKEGSEELATKAVEPGRTNNSSWRPRQRPDADPFSDEQVPSGSAALEGQDETPTEQKRSFGLDAQGSRAPSEGQAPSHKDDASVDNDANHPRNHALGDIPEHNMNAFGGLPRAFANPAFDGGDRSQTSSVNGSKGFPSLGGIGTLSSLGGLGGWPTANAVGTPDRERSGFSGAFGNSLFGSSGELQSPSLGALGGVFGPSGSGTIGRGSKLGSLFPAAMQAQMHGAESEHMNDGNEQRQSGGFGAIGRNAFGRETDSPLRAGRGVFDDMFQPTSNRMAETTAQMDQQRDIPATFAPTPVSGPNYQQSQTSSDSVSSLPQPQQRQMVMPDRMRWVYLDPQGQVQGPWSGLEMHDWYKASFFTADLSVRKLEDAEFEPLGQLIRRIGNSREPFLVPQIGVAHGAPATQAPFATSTAASAPQGGTVQPPFAGAFPSFGTTLTAEQQNNLERRKQEEQYLMARQREFLAQQQVSMKQMQMQGGIPSALHHHPSTHSLQSQPSFGSITSPIGMPQGQLPGVSSFFDAARQGPPTGGLGNMSEYFREDELARLNLQERQTAFSGLGPQMQQGQQMPSAFAQQQDIQRDAIRMEQLRQNEQANPRLREFEQLRIQHEQDQEQANLQAPSGAAPIGPPLQRQQQEPILPQSKPVDKEDKQEPELSAESGIPQSLTLTEQVQKAASAKHSPAVQPESPWAKVGTGLPMPFPPPRETDTPLPAPTAQRGRSDLAETLNMGTRSRSESPENAVTTPSIAPWAKAQEQAEAPKGPSLKEIQEAEAKKAAKVEEAALAARRAAAELELRSQPALILPAPGLPTTSNWATTGSPAPVLAGAASPWMTPKTAKVATPSAIAAANKKTLADIQKEEESRKLKLAAAAASLVPTGQPSGGKRYADLASKPNAPLAAGGVWSTVGASGKARAPTGPAAQQIPSVTRSVSTTSVPAGAATKVVSRPVSVASRNVSTNATASGPLGVSAATQEFQKWAMLSLEKGGLHSDINVKDFVSMLSDFPAETSIIADSIYANSSIMDGRRFAEEFIRRRKLAEKGVIENAGIGLASGGSSAGGWSDVAKKNPVKEETATPAGFKVVPNKKKGRK